MIIFGILLLISESVFATLVAKNKDWGWLAFWSLLILDTTSTTLKYAGVIPK